MYTILVDFILPPPIEENMLSYGGLRASTRNTIFVFGFSLPKFHSRLNTRNTCVAYNSVLTFHRLKLTPSKSPRNNFKRSLCADGDSNSWTSRIGEESNCFSANGLLQVVLCSPQIPGNTGSIARTCAATAVQLHLVEPLGFVIDDTKLKRAGLDYWPYVVVKVHKSWSEFFDYFLLQDGEKRLLAFTKRGKTLHTEVSYKQGDWLLFGSETSGLPSEALNECISERYGGGTIRIPMIETHVRSLNLAVSAGIAIYEALRQIGYDHLDEKSSESVKNVLEHTSISLE